MPSEQCVIVINCLSPNDKSPVWVVGYNVTAINGIVYKISTAKKIDGQWLDYVRG